MKRRVASFVGLTVALSFALSLSCPGAVIAAPALVAQDKSTANSDFERDSLKGLTGVCVVVEDLKSDAEADGLKHDDIQTDVELRLRQSGIRVLSEQERLQAPGAPYLYVRVTTIKNAFGLYASIIEVQLKQVVLLDRDLRIRAYSATTWDTAEVGTVGASKLRQVRDSVKDHVDKFINDYLAVNPPAARPSGNTTRLAQPSAKPVATTGKIASSECATCYGSTPCHACTNCRYCHHCSKEGGTCGLCGRGARASFAGSR